MDAWNRVIRDGRAIVRFGGETGADSHWGANRYWWVLLGVTVLALLGSGGKK